MSRYSKTAGNLKLNYGFDNALGYWCDIEDNSSNITLVILDESSALTGLSRSEFVEIMEHFEVNKDHLDAVALDLPF